MLYVNFYLRQPKASRETPIIMRLVSKGQRLKYATAEKIHPAAWDPDKQRAKPSRKFPGCLELNGLLEHMRHLAISIYREYQYGHGGLSPDLQVVKAGLDKKLDRVAGEKQGFLHFFQQLIIHSGTGFRLNPQTGKPISANTIKTYTTTLRHLRRFAAGKKQALDFSDITLEFYYQYTAYLTGEAKLSTNTIGRHIQVIKLVMNEGLEAGLHTNITHKSRRFVTVREMSDSIYLSEAELQAIASLDLTMHPRLERVRDLFLVGSYTGLRYSDYSVLKPSHIRHDLIEIRQVKTNDPVVIPLHDTVKRIMAQYQGGLPQAISNQKTNKYLKAMGRLAPCLQQEVTRSFTKGGRRQQTTHAKWELLSTHTARRSFATNEYLAGTPALTIMAVTGHRTEKAFLRYIKLTPTDHARLLKKHWDQRKATASLAVA